MKALISFAAVVVLALIAYFGAAEPNLRYVFGVVIPYAAFLTFVAGFVYRIVQWGRSPVPFRIPTTCGQQESLPWVKQNKIENPSTTRGVIARMALEVLVFRSLFRNLKTEMKDGKLAYGSDKWLWVAGLAFHYSFLIILIRHLRFFLEDIPFILTGIESLDSFLQIGVPLLYTTDIVILAAVTYLFLRRIFIPQVKYISLAADYFPLFLIFGIALSGVLMRYFIRVDVVGIKVLAMGLISFSPVVPEGISSFFFIHLLLICSLFAYFPFSKLMHMGGIFLSPTRNLANDSRMVRHVNPWNYPVKVHTYEEYEDDFRDKMKNVGIPVEKE
jgi:nitrate reductase gamma subunit